MGYVDNSNRLGYTIYGGSKFAAYYWVIGGTGRTTTLSSGSTELSVVYPNQSSVNAAKEAIRKVIAGESLHPEENAAQ